MPIPTHFLKISYVDILRIWENRRKLWKIIINQKIIFETYLHKLLFIVTLIN